MSDRYLSLHCNTLHINILPEASHTVHTYIYVLLLIFNLVILTVVLEYFVAIYWVRVHTYFVCLFFYSFVLFALIVFEVPERSKVLAALLYSSEPAPCFTRASFISFNIVS